MSWTKGRAILLAGALLFFASWITFEVAGNQSNDVIPFQSADRQLAALGQPAEQQPHHVRE